jgi:ABC-type Mn2+/Zn2+ transport system permease subunit
VTALLTHDYTRRALVELLLVAVLAGVVGVYVVLRRLAFFTMAMTHATFPGLVLAALLGLNLTVGSGLFGLLIVLAAAWLTRTPGRETSSVVGVVLAGGFALGVVLASAQAGFSKDLTAYLVGQILTVQAGDIAVTATVAAAVLALLAALHKELVFSTFDPHGAAASGQPTLLLDLAMLLAVEATVVTLLPAVGLILAVALIVAPAATARLWCDALPATFLASVLIAAGSGVTGLWLSTRYDVAAGATIVLVAAGAFTLSLVLAPLVTRRATA